MTKGLKLSVATVALISMGGFALADGTHGAEGQAPMWGQGQASEAHDMMQMMIQMHMPMMAGHGSAGGIGMMGSGGPLSGIGPGMGMMGYGGSQSGMSMMGSGVSVVGLAMDRFDMDGDGIVTSEEAHEGLQALFADYDANGDETLSLDEFEALHSALIRETMVDRFQFLDDDGDGAVTLEEMVEPADMMHRMETMLFGTMAGQVDRMPGNGGMIGAQGQGHMGDN